MSEPTVAAARESSRAAVRAGAEVIEWRLDALAVDDLADAGAAIGGLAREVGVEILATYRSIAEGGAGPLGDDAYRDLLLALLEHPRGLAAVDVELSRPEEDVAAIVAAARCAEVPTVGSSHDFTGFPDDVVTRFAELARRGHDVLKVAVTAGDDLEVIRLLEAAVTARHTLGRAVVPIAMGERGVLTRVGGALWGAPFTFARHGAGSAPGQPTVSEVAAALALLGGTS
ncbi:type I 3-dehydroquinate dehydratase [Serinibacter salmoneus]|uniref:type I 3-dehydroquinate dehydratase n=1 Tax=Serinibacter salmoneus TaxID=556530 RepID=UPI0014731ADD|nr:type I 3-dehydroquinate dehydratase [Serinibacter salmoneus]